MPQARAWLALKAGDAQRALVLLERVRAHDAASYAPYLRGLAYLQLKDSRNAIASFQDATRRQRRCLLASAAHTPCPTWGWAASTPWPAIRAKAKKAYDVFFTEWKNADSDLPVIAEAKKEYAQL